MVLFFYYSEPRQHILLELLRGLCFWFVLHIKYRRQVPLLQSHIIYIMLRLIGTCRFVAPEMICPTDKAILPCLIEVVNKPVIKFGRALRGFDHDKTDGMVVYKTVIAQHIPVYLSLIMADIYAMYLIVIRIGGITIQSLPSESERTHKEIIEEADIKGNNQ